MPKNGVSNRRNKVPERKFVARCLERVKENTVETEEVIQAFAKSRNISKSSAVASSVHQVLMANNLGTWLLEQLERSPPGETRNPFQDKFEDRLMKIFRGLLNYDIFRYIIDDVKKEINMQINK